MNDKIRYSLIVLFIFSLNFCDGQTVLNGSINGSPTGNSNFVNVSDWFICTNSGGWNNSPDLNDINFPSWNGSTTVTPIESPDGGTWFGLANGTNPVEQECVIGNMTGLTPGQNYNLQFYGACFGSGNGNYANSSPCGVDVTIGPITEQISIPMLASTWNRYCISFVADASDMTFRVQNIIGGGYASLDGFSVAETGGSGGMSGTFLGADTVLCVGQQLSLNAWAQGATYLWQDNTTNSEYIVSMPGLYSVTVNSGCSVLTDSILVLYDACDTTISNPSTPAVVVLDMPNVITADGDGVNDTFVPIEWAGLMNATITISNRWGSVVYDGGLLNGGWDGRYEGTLCAEGTYFWIVHYKDLDGKDGTIHGFLSLVL